MNDCATYDSLYISGTGKRVVDVSGGIRASVMEIELQTLTQQLDVTETARIGGDLNVCGDLRVATLFRHSGDTPDDADHNDDSLIWRKHHVPDTHPTDNRRYSLGSDTRRWHTVWSQTTNAHTTTTQHLAASTAHIDTIESASMVVDCLMAKSISTPHTVYNQGHGLIDISTPITILKPDSSAYNATGTVVLELRPCEIDGACYDIIAITPVTVVLPNTVRRAIPKCSSIKLLYCDGDWVCVS